MSTTRTYSSDVAFSPSVKAVQTRKGSRALYARVEAGGSWEHDVSAWEVNCPQHIPQKIDAKDVEAALEPLRARIAELEAENIRLRGA